MKTPTIQLPKGRDALALALPGVEQIRGVTIDNPSGSWLLVMPTSDYVAPYTVQWSRGYSVGMTHIDILYVEGPAGQRSTLDGDIPSVILDSEPAGFSNGEALAFVTRGEQPEWRSATVNLNPIGLAPDVKNTVLATATQRIRCYSFALFGLTGFNFGDKYLFPTRVYCQQSINGALIVVLDIGPNKPTDWVQLNPPTDLLPGASIQSVANIMGADPVGNADDSLVNLIIQYGLL